MVLYVIQEKLIFHNEKLSQDYQFQFEQPYEEVYLDTKDGNQIHGILFTVENPKGIILYFHGNAGSLKRWGFIGQDFTKYGYDVFIIDYRSYGKSTGNFEEKAMYSDAEVAYQYVKQIYGEDKIHLYGRSLGCTFATKMASVHHPKQLILEAPFYNLKDPARYHYPFLPYSLLMKYKFESGQFIPNVSCKTTIFHGTDDGVISIASARKLYDVADQSHTEMIELVDGTHHNCSEFGVYKERVTQLME